PRRLRRRASSRPAAPRPRRRTTSPESHPSMTEGPVGDARSGLPDSRTRDVAPRSEAGHAERPRRTYRGGMSTALPVVLLHGARTSRTMWRPQVEALERAGRTALAVDLPG